ncbi:MAG: oligosaccharide flippase family protein [Gemmatimonadetes bacterium]|nr:oligosaccharide flippase family protein [Gemmatimonadota bacterium]
MVYEVKVRFGRSGRHRPVGASLLARNTLLNVAGQVLPLLVAVAAMPAVVRGLGQERFGVLAIAWMVLGYLAELGFGRATTRFVAEAFERDGGRGAAEIVWTTVAFQGALGVLAGLLLVLSAPVLAGRVLRIPAELIPEAQVAFYLIAVALPVILVGSAFRGVLEALQRFDLVNAVRTPVGAANYLFPLVGVALGWTLAGIVGLLVVARAVALAVYGWLAARVVPALFERPRVLGRGQARGTILRFGGWVTVSTLVSPLLVYLDRFALGALVGMTAVAYYAAPYEVAVRLLLLPAAAAATLFPAFSALAGAQEARAARTLLRGAVVWLLPALAIPAAVLVIAGEELLGLWLGADFARESTRALQILAAGALVNGLAFVPFTQLQGLGRADLTGKFHLLELPVHLVLVWLLVARWGVTGAALAWTIRVTLDAALLFGAAGRIAPAGSTEAG